MSLKNIWILYSIYAQKNGGDLLSRICVQFHRPPAGGLTSLLLFSSYKKSPVPPTGAQSFFILKKTAATYAPEFAFSTIVRQLAD